MTQAHVQGHSLSLSNMSLHLMLSVLLGFKAGIPGENFGRYVLLLVRNCVVLRAAWGLALSC